MILFYSVWLMAITYILYGKKGELARQQHWFTTAIVLTGALLLLNLTVATLPEQLIIAISTIPVAASAMVKQHYFNIARWCVLLPAIVAFLLLF